MNRLICICLFWCFTQILFAQTSNDYNPSNPPNPDMPVTTYMLTLQATPTGSGTFNINSSQQYKAGAAISIYAYSNANWQFREWRHDGEVISNDSHLSLNMPATDVQLTAFFDYVPASPANPGANYWNSETGEVIIDDFTPGNLNSTISTIIGSGNSSKVTRITVAGRVTSNDWGIAKNYNNCLFLDMSRTSGLTSVPSYNFSGNSSLTDIVLPADIERIESYAFRNCASLQSIVCYAYTPPTLGTSPFTGIAEGLIVYVPADALSLYQEAEGWKDFTILPLANQVSSLEVNLSSDENFNTTPYKDMFVELINTVSGQKQRYVITNRVTYTFNSLPKRTNYNVYLRNGQGDVLGEIDDVAVGYDGQGDVVKVTFSDLMVPRDLKLTVLTPDGEDVTAQTTITWYDQKDTYLTKGSTLTAQLEGVSVKYRVQLPQALAMLYQLPADATYEVQAANDITLTLVGIPQTTISGRVLDIKTGQPLNGATVAVSQMLNGLYSKSFTTKTDSKGQWSLQVYEAKTDITASMDDYVSKTQSFEKLVAEIPDFELKDISGTTIAINLTYQPTGGELQEYYTDYANVAYTVYNATAGKNVTELNVQYPQIVLMEQLPVGTVLRVTATSKNQKFVPVTATATVDSLDRASVTLPIVQLGGITASFRQTDNPAVVGILYDGNGRLLKKYEYASATLNINELQDGQYTLVTMASTQLFSTVGSLSQFAEAGLREGVDYVKNSVTVRSGEMAAIENPLIPFLDESKLYYTGDGTSITVNKSQVTTGNYLTITGHIDFKAAYADQVSDVKLIVDLPEESAFVDNSVMRGAQTATYTYADGQVIVPLDYYGERVRFCFIPTAGGDFTATGSVQFTLGGKTITQPIGNANFTVKDLGISLPSVVAKTTVPVSGTAVGKSTVEVYDNGTLLGQAKALANGAWATTVELVNPYNLSTHSIYAKITTKDGVEMQSETKELTYDMNAIQIQKVTMYHYNPEMHTTFESVFDFQNPHTTPNQWTVYYPNKKFTYTVEFTNNSPEKVSNVILYVHAADGQIVPLYPTYDEKKDIWVADIDMGNRSDGYYPVNVSVDYDSYTEVIASRQSINESFLNTDDTNSESEQYLRQVNALQTLLDDCDENSIEYEQYRRELYELLGISDNEIEFDSIEDIDAFMSESQTYFSVIDNGLFERDSLVMDGLLNLDISQVGELSTALGLEGAFTIESCESLTVNELIEKGYTSLSLDDETEVYYLITELEYDYVDFVKGIHVHLTYDNSDESQLSRRTSSTPIAKLEEWINKINEKLEPVKNQVNFLQGVCRNLTDKLNSAIGDTKYDISRNRQRIAALGDYMLKHDVDVDDYANEINKLRQKNKQLEDQLKKLNACKSTWAKAASKVTAIFGLVNNMFKLSTDLKEYVTLYYSVPSCPCDETLSDNLRNRIAAYGAGRGAYYFGSILSDVAAIHAAWTSVAAAPATGGTSIIVTVGAIGKILLQMVLNGVADWHNDKMKKNFRTEISSLSRNASCFSCPDGGGGGSGSGGPGGGSSGGGTGSGSSNDGVKIDPSGYVYEGVASNRLQGVTATAYYKETVEDMYGDLHENIVLWDAEEYAQENPLFTDEYGMYQWDVPQGLWQVKFEKEGYQTTYSEWLPVPPPQLEVNIAMTQLLQPTVASAKVYSEGVEVTFDKYMNPETLTADHIIVTRNGAVADGTVELLNEEVAYEGKSQTYASKVRFTVPEDAPLLSTDEVMLTVKKTVESYAGMQMQDTYTQAFDVEPRVTTIVVDSLINVAYGGERTLTVAALPADASKGKTMRVQSLSTMIASTDSNELTLDENGQAELKVSGELPGSTVIKFTIDDADVTGSMTVNVKDATNLVTMAPRASRVSGTEVYRGTEIRLTSETEGAEIWYTLDGSCPCNTETALKYNPDEPIIIAGDSVKIKAIAIGHDLAESDISEFSYTLKTTALGYQLSEGWTWVSHNIEEGVPSTAFATNAERIVGQRNEMINDPVFGLVGGLQTMLPTEAYKLRLSAQTSNRLEGYEFNARDNRVPLRQGWNWIGYPVNQAMTLSEALAYFEASEGDYLVGQDGYAEYVDGKWQGSLEGMIPGQGFVYKSATTSAIPFNTAIVSTASSRMGKRNYLIGSPWAPAKNLYPNVMPLTAEVYNEGVKVSEDDYVVGAFAESECRGVGQWKNGRLLMTVYGDLGEDIRFVATQRGSDRFYDITEHVNFTPDNIGSWHYPMQLTLGSEVTAVRKTFDGQLSVTPAVAHDYVTVSVGGRNISHLTFTAMNGQTVISVSNVGKSATIATGQLPDGIYIVTVQAEGQSYYKKVLKANN